MEEIVTLIEGEPEISAIAVEPGKTNNHLITVSSNESKIAYEGTVTYDVRFFVWLPGKEEQIKVIVDVEAQKSFYPGYDISTRGVFIVREYYQLNWIPNSKHQITMI